MNDTNDHPLSQTEREMLGLDSAPITYSYHCQRCQYEEEIEDIVVNGFAAMADLPPGQMPRLVCPHCGGSLCAVTD